jgi:23S rRNA pseudouridine1911/1915/1917 synthase
MDIPVLYEDASILALNKPAGLIVHGDGKRSEPTLVDFVIARYPRVKGVGEMMVAPDGTTIDRSGVVHRIDRETSGVILFAKTQEAFLYLKRQFQSRQVKKRYHAFIWGTMRDVRGTIDRPIGRSPRDVRKWSAGRGARGEMRPAITRWRVMSVGGGISFIEALPVTGRTHQIRVHFLAVNHPIVGDSLYAPARESALGFSRLALHARGIMFRISGGREVMVEAPYPDDFAKGIEAHKALGALPVGKLRE